MARAHALQQQFASDALRVDCALDVAGIDQPVDDAKASPTLGDDLAYDIVINASASSLAGDLPTLPVGAITAGTLAYDMMYSATQTVFMTHAAALGARVFDGLGMLVEQAAESFERWRGIRPDGATVLCALRDGRDPLEALLAAGAASVDTVIQHKTPPLEPGSLTS
jgi:shikimate dehydrogenase